jgi:hypothetical protein
MTQKLTVLVQQFPWVKFPVIKTKKQIRREASIKAARTLKRLKMARAAARQIDLEEAIAEKGKAA